MVTKKELGKGEIANMVCSQWEPLTATQRDILSRHITIEKFKKNEIIFKESESPLQMMCLIQGKVKVFKEGMGHIQIIRVVKPVEMFGYRAYFARDTYKTNAMAFEPSVVAMIPMSVIVHLMEECQGMAKAIVGQLSKELGRSDERIVNLTQKHIRGRLAEGLLFLKDSYGTENGNNTLGISLSREDLANLTNMTTSNAIRTLSTFAAEQLISIDGRKIQILKENELRKISKNG